MVLIEAFDDVTDKAPSVCVMEVPALRVSSNIALWFGRMEVISLQQKLEGRENLEEWAF